MKRITRSSLARIAAAPARATAAERESEEALNRSTRRVKHATRVLESLMAELGLAVEQVTPTIPIGKEADDGEER